jgi:hypothetical protein
MLARNQLQSRSSGQRSHPTQLDKPNLREVLLLLRFVAVANNLMDAEVGVGAVRQRDAAAGTTDFLQDQAVLGEAETKPTKLLCHRKSDEKTNRETTRPGLDKEKIETFKPRTRGCDAEKAHFPKLLPEVLRKSRESAT